MIWLPIAITTLAALWVPYVISKSQSLGLFGDLAIYIHGTGAVFVSLLAWFIWSILRN